MSKTAKRPEGVPAKAWWDEGDKEWVFGPMVDGEKHGDFTYWRADGTKCNESHMVHGTPVGPFKRFHETGEISQDGEFDENGQLHGTRRWFSIDGETTENTRPNGVHERVMRSEMDRLQKKHVSILGIRHFNADDVRVLPRDGEPYPELPEGVDAGAEYVEPVDEWHLGSADGESQEKQGVWKKWTRDGRLKEQVTYEDDALVGPATHYILEDSPFADARIVSERGEYVQIASAPGSCATPTARCSRAATTATPRRSKTARSPPTRTIPASTTRRWRRNSKRPASTSRRS